jgi:hypothetical protein
MHFGYVNNAIKYLLYPNYLISLVSLFVWDSFWEADFHACSRYWGCASCTVKSFLVLLLFVLFIFCTLILSFGPQNKFARWRKWGLEIVYV